MQGFSPLVICVFIDSGINSGSGVKQKFKISLKSEYSSDVITILPGSLGWVWQNVNINRSLKCEILIFLSLKSELKCKSSSASEPISSSIVSCRNRFNVWKAALNFSGSGKFSKFLPE